MTLGRVFSHAKDRNQSRSESQTLNYEPQITQSVQTPYLTTYNAMKYLDGTVASYYSSLVQIICYYCLRTIIIHTILAVRSTAAGFDREGSKP